MKLRIRSLTCILVFWVLSVPGAVSRADLVVLRDGTSLEGTVTQFESGVLTVALASGERRRVPRAALARVEFREESAPAPFPPVAVRIVDADDRAEILLNGASLLGPAQKSEWTPIVAKLAEGNNELRIRVFNDRDGWAYHWALRVGTKVRDYRCGEPRRRDGGCRRNGGRGTESGAIDDLPPVWLHCESKTGTCEIDEPVR